MKPQEPVTTAAPSATATADNIYLPTQPSDPSGWADVPMEHFQAPEVWLRRIQFKDIYHISDRAYFRWIERLKENGLNRSLPASRDSRVALFYKPDIDRVSAQVAQAAAIPHRGQNFKAVASIRESLPQGQPAPAATPQAATLPPIAPPTPTTPQRAAAIATAPAIATAALSVDAEALALLRSQQIALQHQNAALVAAITRLDASLHQLQFQYDALRTQIHQPPATAPQSQITAQNSHPSPSEMSILLAKLNKVDRALQRLPQRLSDNVPVNKQKVKAKSKKSAAPSRSQARPTVAKTNRPNKAKTKSRRR